MKSIVRRVYGPPEALRLEEAPMPEVALGRVLVQVRASSVNPLDWHMLRGEPYPLRLSEGLRRPKVVAMGVDVAGTVVAVGNDVTSVKPGDDVIGSANGSLAEFVLVREDRLTRKPADVTFEAASTVACAGCSALQALRDHGKLERGESVLINGASGGVGTYAVQLAKAMGATVTAVCSTKNVELVASLGADQVVDYTAVDFTRLGARHDVVVDCVGNRSLTALRRVLAPRGRLVIVGGGHGKWLGPMLLPIKAVVTSPFVRQKLSFFIADITGSDLAVLAGHLEHGTVIPVIDRTFALPEAAGAIRYLELGHARGKVVVVV